MHRTEKKNPKGLKSLLVVTFIFLALFIASFVLFGVFVSQANDPDLGDFGAVMNYHFSGLAGLFTFNFNDASNVIYLSLSIGMYAFIVFWIIFLILAIVIGKKHKRGIVALGVILTLLAVVIFMFLATGTPKYWLIVNKRNPYEDVLLVLIITYALLATGFLYSLFAFISYLVCLVAASKKAKSSKKEETASEEAPASEEETPVVFEPFIAEPEPEPIPEESAPMLEEPKEDEVYVEKEEEKPLTKEDIAGLIRDIVREEMSRSNPHPQTNVNYPSGPLVVQYFGTVPYPSQPAEQPRKEEPIPESKKEEPKEEEKSEETPVVEEEPVSEPAPVVEEEEPVPEPEEAPAVEEPAPEPEPVVEEEPAVEPEPAPVVEAEPVVEVEKKPILRIPFQERMINADDEMKNNYNELKNEILSYGVNSRVSNSGDAFRLHRKTYVKITIAGLSLKLYFALNPDDYKDSPIPVQNAGHKGIYAEIPLVFKVKSGLSMRRCKELIQTVMEKDGLEQGVIGDTDWVEKLKEAPVEENPEEPDPEA